MPLLTDTQIKVRRDEILSEMQAIREMIRGKISMQSLKRKAADGSVTERGPYAVFQRWIDGSNHSQRIPKEDLPAMTRAVDGYQRFVQLSDEFAALTETLTRRSGPLLPAKKNSSNPPQKKNTGRPKASSGTHSKK
jgi:hypothetical protein